MFYSGARPPPSGQMRPDSGQSGPGGSLQASEIPPQQSSQPNVDVFGSQPFTEGSNTPPGPLLLLGNNDDDDDFNNIRGPPATTESGREGAAVVDPNLKFGDPIRQLDEFGAAPFSPRRTNSHSSSDPDNDSREFNYENATTRHDEEHIHRGLLENDYNSSDDDSDDDSDHLDNDSLTGNLIVVDDQDLSDAELAGLNLGDHTPPGVAVGLLIDTGPEPDPFGQIPFVAPQEHVKPAINQRSEPLSSCTLTPPISPPTQTETDPFGEAPFGLPKVTRKGSRTSSESSDVFAKAPFPAASKKRPESQPVVTGGHKAKSQRSAATQQSVGNPTPPLSPTEMDIFGAKPFHAETGDEAKKEVPDLFGAVPFTTQIDVEKDTNVQSHLKVKQDPGKLHFNIRY